MRFAQSLRDLTLREPSHRQVLLWAAAKATGLPPLDPHLMAMAPEQMQWAILMANPTRRQEIAADGNTQRDSDATLTLQWLMTHITGEGSHGRC